MKSRLIILVFLILAAAGSLFAASIFQRMILHAPSEAGRERAEYMSTTWVSSFVIFGVGAIVTLISIVKYNRRNHDDCDDGIED